MKPGGEKIFIKIVNLFNPDILLQVKQHDDGEDFPKFDSNYVNNYYCEYGDYVSLHIHLWVNVIMYLLIFLKIHVFR